MRIGTFGLAGGMLLVCLAEVWAASPPASTQSDAAAKTFRADSGKGALYVFRDQRLLGASAVLQVVVDGKIAGTTGPRTYFMWQLEPGLHTISSATPENDAVVEVRIEPGGVYFIRQKARFGLVNPGVDLTLVDEQSGREAVRKCRRLRSAF